jgi:hypothetical protein
MLASTFSSFPPSLTILKNHKAKFKEALRKYLITPSFYHVDEFLVKKGFIILFLSNVCSTVHCKHCVCLCIYDSFHILVTPLRIHGMYVSLRTIWTIYPMVQATHTTLYNITLNLHLGFTSLLCFPGFANRILGTFMSC